MASLEFKSVENNQNNITYINNLSKHFLPKMPSQLLPITWVISEIITPKDKAKSELLAREKVRILSKSVLGF